MANKINILIFSFIIFNFYVVLAQSEEQPETTGSDDSPTTTESSVSLKETRTEAERERVKNQDWDVWCKLQPNSHNCSGRSYQTTRYYFDTLLEDCKTFFYGDCTSSYNNFATITECHESCSEVGVRSLHRSNYSDKVNCRLQPSFGIGYEYHPSFYYDINRKACRGFSFSGAGGNGNRFPNSQICYSTCHKVIDSEINI